MSVLKRRAILYFAKTSEDFLQQWVFPNTNRLSGVCSIDSSNQSLKCVLLHNANTYAGVPIGHTVTLKESYSTVEMVLQKLCYNEHK